MFNKTNGGGGGGGAILLVVPENSFIPRLSSIHLQCVVPQSSLTCLCKTVTRA